MRCILLFRSGNIDLPREPDLTRRILASPIATYLVAIAASGVAFMLTLVLILEFKYPNLERVGAGDAHPVVVAVLFSAALGAIFAAARPAHALRLAVLASSIFWGFFTVVFFCYLVNGEVDWIPLGQAVLTLSSAVAAAVSARWISARLRSRPAH